MDRPSLRGLYAITPDASRQAPGWLEARVEAALIGGARLIQYRDKHDDHRRRRACALALRHLCRRYQALLIINDDVDLALSVDADGVHLGLDDMPLMQARAMLGPQAVIGVTCADSVDRALTASEGGADYLALGAFFPSATKPDARRASLALLEQVRSLSSLPICAIGGITPGRAGDLIRAGADLIAAVEGVFAADDVKAAAQAYASQF